MESNEEITINNKMLEKSQEAFLLSIEIYNKPTIKYRLEGFAFFICNAWELMLKSYMIQKFGSESIYYKDKPERTIALSDCIKKIFTNEADPIRKNLEILVELRNTSTHFIIPEMENIYLPFLQSNVLNYSQKIFDFFCIDITEVFDTSFLSLMVKTQSFNDTEILGKYGKELFDKYKKLETDTDVLLKDNANSKLAININFNLRVVKNKNDADVTFSFCKDANESAYIFEHAKDINTTYPYTQKTARLTITHNLNRKGIDVELHQTNFNLICTKFDLKKNEDYFYWHELMRRYSCSQKLVNFITELLTKQPTIIDEIKLENKKQS